MTGQIKKEQTNTPPGVEAQRVEISCETCLYWEYEEETREGKTGKCRRNAPPARSTEKLSGTYALWPMTSEFDWCGEWRRTTVASNA